MKKINLNDVDYVKVMQGDDVRCFFLNSCSSVGYGKLCYYRLNGSIINCDKFVIFEVNHNEFIYNYL
jgi:hypothetical protein